jgi:two-component system, NarL family, response regulator LiaR
MKSSELDTPTEIVFTPREQEVLQCLVNGRFDQEIAGELKIGLKTVSYHCGNIYRKLDVSCRNEAANWALLNGFMPTT